jgi:hypothetical protein
MEILYSTLRKTDNFNFLIIYLGYLVLLLKSACEALDTPDEKRNTKFNG